MTDAASPPGSPPGWYPDPGGQPVQRWWSGTGWTDATQPVPQAGLAPNEPLNDGDAPAPLPRQRPQRPARMQGRRRNGRLRQFAWASVPVWSLGFLAFLPFLRLAFARRTARAWGVFVAYLAASAVEVVLLGIGAKGAGQAAVGWAMIMLMGFAATHAFISFSPAKDALNDSAGFSSPQSNHEALASAQARMQRRKEARELARANPVLARELRIGRPDMAREYDDGGLVDVNNVPAETLTSALGLTPQETAAVAAARAQLGKFTSADEVSLYADLAPDRVDAIRDLLLFG